MTEAKNVRSLDEPAPIWHYGFVYDNWAVFKLVREVQEKGGAPPGYARLPDIDIGQFASYIQELENDRSALVPDEQVYTMVDLGAWGRDYIQDHVRMDDLVYHIRRVYRDEFAIEPTRMFAFAAGRGWKATELDVQLQEQSANLPSADKMDKFAELLGPPGWYMEHGECAKERKAQYEARMRGAPVDNVKQRPGDVQGGTQ